MGQTAEVVITDVALRDGLQIQERLVSTPDKLAILEGLQQAGVASFEVGSFVKPSAVPQMADTEELIEAMSGDGAFRHAVLVPNVKGADRALESGVRDVRIVLSASEGHSQSNTNRSVAEGVSVARQIVERLREDDQVRVSAAVATAFVCPYDGITSLLQVEQVVGELAALGLEEVVLADTIGRADPAHVRRLVDSMLSSFPEITFGLHLHNTYGMALAGVVVGLEHGVRHFDAALGGIGGCPFAPGAAGNVATEDVVNMLEAMGVSTGIDFDGLAKVAVVLREAIGAPLESAVSRALGW